MSRKPAPAGGLSTGLFRQGHSVLHSALLPHTPAADPEKVDRVWRVGKYTFRADFDSANLQDVRQGNTCMEYNLWTRRDCQDTLNERATRTWFFFGVSGHAAGEAISMTIMNLNKQGRLYSQDYRPWFWHDGMAEWTPLSAKATYKRDDDDFRLKMIHRFSTAEPTYFAFAIPFSYQDTQVMLDRLDFAMAGYMEVPLAPPAPTAVVAASVRDGTMEASMPPGQDPGMAPRAPAAASAADSSMPSSSSNHSGTCGSRGSSAGGCSSRLYYRRQLLTRSMHGLRVDLLTITDCHGALAELEVAPKGVFEHDPGPPCATFKDKKVFFVSSRVHPGETPATHMLNGMLAFLLEQDDPRAAALRRRFVFKLVPIVNPDGVAAGNYRTDTLGQNLNRFYLGTPDPVEQSSVYAIKQLLTQYSQQGLLEFYIDLHAHANKKGVFIFGNALEGEASVQSLLYAKLVSLNNPVFDYMSCNFTEKNINKADRDGLSKEGAGRVALFRETGLTHLYTVEANYNTARLLNAVPPASGDHGGRVSPPCAKRFPPKFTAGVLQSVGRALLVSALDLVNANPWTRLPNSEYRSVEGVRNWIVSILKASDETRAAHLPPLGDTSLGSLKAMLASGALRSSVVPSTSLLRRAGRPPLRPSEASPSSSAIGYSSTSSSCVSSPSLFGPGRSPSMQRRSPCTPSRPSALPAIGLSGSSSVGGSITRSSSLPVRASIAGAAPASTGQRSSRAGSQPDVPSARITSSGGCATMLAERTDSSSGSGDDNDHSECPLPVDTLPFTSPASSAVRRSMTDLKMPAPDSELPRSSSPHSPAGSSTARSLSVDGLTTARDCASPLQPSGRAVTPTGICGGGAGGQLYAAQLAARRRSGILAAALEGEGGLSKAALQTPLAVIGQAKSQHRLNSLSASSGRS